MKNLLTLIKLQKTKVDEQRLLVVKLQTQLDDILGNINALDSEKNSQEDAVRQNPGLGITYADYLNMYLERKALLEKKRTSTEYAIDLARDQLSELFEEQKRYEIAHKNRQDEMTREEKRVEGIKMDEVGSISYQRKKNGNK